MQRNQRTIEVGTKVQFSRQWLQATGNWGGILPFARGTVTLIETLGKRLTLATVDWQDERVPSKIYVDNLNIIGRPEAY